MLNNKSFTLIELLLVMTILTIMSKFILSLLNNNINKEFFIQTEERLKNIQKITYFNKKNYLKDNPNIFNQISDLVSSSKTYSYNILSNNFYGWDGPYTKKDLQNPFANHYEPNNLGWIVSNNNSSLFINTKGAITTDYDFSSNNYPSNPVINKNFIQKKVFWSVKEINFINLSRQNNIPRFFNQITNTLETRENHSINARIIIYDGSYSLNENFVDFFSSDNNKRYEFNKRLIIPTLNQQESIKQITQYNFATINTLKDIRLTRISLLLIEDDGQDSDTILERIIPDFEPININLQENYLPQKITFYSFPPINNYPTQKINFNDLEKDLHYTTVKIIFSRNASRFIHNANFNLINMSNRITTSIAQNIRFPDYSVTKKNHFYELAIPNSFLNSGTQYTISIDSEYGNITQNNDIRLLLTIP